MKHLLAIAACSAATAAASSKLALGPANVVNGLGMSWYDSPVSALLDEQTLAGDPRGGKGGVPAVPWQTTWDGTYYGTPQVGPFAIINLNASVALDSVWLYRSWGHFPLNLTFGPDPFTPSPNGSWNYTVGQPPGQGWVCIANGTASTVGQYLVVSVDGPAGNDLSDWHCGGTSCAATRTKSRTSHPAHAHAHWRQRLCKLGHG